MKKLLSLAVVAACFALSGQAMAHGALAKHGGIVQSANDLTFELVNKDGKTTLYIDDHGKEVATAGASGTLTVLKGGRKAEFPLEAGGANTLLVKGDAGLAAGAKAVAAITFADKKTVSVRFSVK